jgi:hypothetical protein
MAAKLQLHTVRTTRQPRDSGRIEGYILPGRPKLMTRSSATLSLFAEPSPAAGRPASFALSVLAHLAVAGILYFALTHLPRIEDPSLLQRYTVRQLDLHALDPDFPETPQAIQHEVSKIPYPTREVVERISGGVTPDMADAMRAFISAAVGRQLLIQPELQTHLAFAQQVPLPTFMIWAPESAPRRRVVVPLPEPATASNVPPSFQLPNEEIRLADVGMAATPVPPRALVLPASTTSPVETRSLKPEQRAQSTISPSLELSTPTPLLSVSDLHMPEGMVFLPPVNDAGPGPSANLGGGARSPAMPGALPAGNRENTDETTPDGRRLSSEHIVLSRNGKFSVVVVGGSLAEQYPETAELWANRVAYTAYLHVGLNKNWILQYSTTRPAEASEAGRVARLDAPWPYDILRPNLLARDVNGDAIMVHGILNQAGHLESLAIAFPSGFRYAGFVLRALRQWQFRPAQRNGQPTPVEVLLIIPEELD